MLDKEKSVTYEEAIDKCAATFKSTSSIPVDEIKAISSGIVGAIAIMFCDKPSEDCLEAVKDDLEAKAKESIRKAIIDYLEKED